MEIPSENSHPDDSPENVIPNRVLLFLVE